MTREQLLKEITAKPDLHNYYLNQNATLKRKASQVRPVSWLILSLVLFGLSLTLLARDLKPSWLLFYFLCGCMIAAAAMMLKAVIQSFRLSRCIYVFSDSDITVSQGAKVKTLPFKNIVGITPFGLVAPLLSGGRVKDLVVECDGKIHFIKDLPDCSLIVPMLCDRIAKARNLSSPYDVIGLSQDKERFKKRFKL